MRWGSACTFVIGAALGLLAVAAPLAAAAQSRPLISKSIVDSRRVTLEGNTRPEANPANDRGIVADSLPIEHMLLLLNRPPEQEQALEDLLEQQQDRQSPNYHRWLSAAEFGTQFGPAASDIAAVSRWLVAHGFRVDTVYPSGVVIDFSGTAGQVREAFHTEIHNLDVGGTHHIANIGDPQIPAALAPAVAGIALIDDFEPKPMQEPQSTFSAKCSSDAVIDTCYAIVPADLAKIYGLAPLFRAGITGEGETIVVIEDQNIYRARDWRRFRERFGLAKYPGSFQQVHPQPPSGGSNCRNPGIVGSGGEPTLDAEWASAAAPGAAIVLASCTRLLVAIHNLVNSESPPDVVSMSYGGCEANSGAAVNHAFSAVFQQAAAEGISVFVSSGDSGAEICSGQGAPGSLGIGVNGHGSTRYNVSVGGTDFADTHAGTNSLYWNASDRPNGGSAKSYIPEIPWNGSCASTLLAQFITGSPLTYGAGGFCNSAAGQIHVQAEGGNGGPSGCAKGKPSTPGVVSGTCSGHKKPRWQAGILGNPDDGVRDVPDVALFAAGGTWGHRYVTCNSSPKLGKTCHGPLSGWAGSGGTSYSSPIMAGIQALVDQSAGGRQGNPNPVYYRLAAEDYANLGAAACNSSLGTGIAKGCVFHNVTAGDNDQPCSGGPDCYLPSGTYGVLSTSTNAYKPAFTAGTGWNFATGLGSVDAQNLVKRWPK